MGGAGARRGGDARAVHGHPGELRDQSERGRARPRHPQDRNGSTPKDQFFTTQHYGHPAIDPAAFNLKITGQVERPRSLTVDEIKAMGRDEVASGFECSGNGRGRIQGFASNGRWTGVPLRKVLKEAGLKDDGHEVVFFGADHGEEETEFRQTKVKLDQAFGRSLPREKALSVRADDRLRAERRAADETSGRAAASDRSRAGMASPR